MCNSILHRDLASLLLNWITVQSRVCLRFTVPGNYVFLCLVFLQWPNEPHHWRNRGNGLLHSYSLLQIVFGFLKTKHEFLNNLDGSGLSGCFS
jgi:hypothetical protein